MILARMEILLVVIAVQVLNTAVFVWSRRGPPAGVEARPFTLRGCLADGLIDHPHTLPHCDFRSLPCPNTPRMGFCGVRDIVEVILDLRLAAGAPQSPEFTAIREELDLLSPGSDPVVSSRSALTEDRVNRSEQ